MDVAASRQQPRIDDTGDERCIRINPPGQRKSRFGLQIDCSRRRAGLAIVQIRVRSEGQIQGQVRVSIPLLLRWATRGFVLFYTESVVPSPIGSELALAFRRVRGGRFDGRFNSFMLPPFSQPRRNRRFDVYSLFRSHCQTKPGKRFGIHGGRSRLHSSKDA